MLGREGKQGDQEEGADQEENDADREEEAELALGSTLR